MAQRVLLAHGSNATEAEPKINDKLNALPLGWKVTDLRLVGGDGWLVVGVIAEGRDDSVPEGVTDL